MKIKNLAAKPTLVQSSVLPTLLDITSLLLWITGHRCSVVLAILAFLKAWNGTRFFFANKCTIPRLSQHGKHWGTVFPGAARRRRGDGLSASWPFISAIILWQGGDPTGELLRCTLSSRWYAVIRPFESSSVSFSSLSHSLSSPPLLLLVAHKLLLVLALHHSKWRSIKSLWMT